MHGMMTSEMHARQSAWMQDVDTACMWMQAPCRWILCRCLRAAASGAKRAFGCTCILRLCCPRACASACYIDVHVHVEVPLHVHAPCTCSQHFRDPAPFRDPHATSMRLLAIEHTPQRGCWLLSMQSLEAAGYEGSTPRLNTTHTQ